jgi:tetratricopeptide (TPR) repeat protein
MAWPGQHEISELRNLLPKNILLTKSRNQEQTASASSCSKRMKKNNPMNVPECLAEAITAMTKVIGYSDVKGDYVHKTDLSGAYQKRYSAGLALFQSQQYAAALEALEESWRMSNGPENLNALVLMAEVYAAKRELDEAQNRYLFAIVEAYGCLGDLDDEFSKEYRQLRLTIADALNGMGVLYRLRAQTSEKGPGVAAFSCDGKTLVMLKCARDCYRKALEHSEEDVYRDNLNWVVGFIKTIETSRG